MGFYGDYDKIDHQNEQEESTNIIKVGEIT